MFSLLALGVYLALLPIIIPVTVWLRYVTWVKQQPPGPAMELTKASHGAGMIWLSMLILMMANDHGVPLSFSPLWVPLGIMVVWGSLWLVTSGQMVRLYGSQGPLDLIVLVRSGVKIALGWAILHFSPFNMDQLIAAASTQLPWQAIALALVLVVGWFTAMWCISTGAVKFLLVLVSRVRRGRKAPPAVKDPRGGARDATRAEARQAMRGKGGRASALDEQEF